MIRLFSLTTVACLFLPLSTAMAEDAPAEDAPAKYAVTAGARVVVERDYGFAALELGGGVRTKERTIWYVRGQLAPLKFWEADLHEGMVLELRTGPVWRHCMLSGCLGVSTELGVERLSGEHYRDGLSMGPEPNSWHEVQYSVFGEVRFHGEIYYYRDGLVSLEVSLGARLGVGRIVAREPDFDGGGDGAFGGAVAGAALIVRR